VAFRHGFFQKAELPANTLFVDDSIDAKFPIF
jgi:hypothetical protein